MTDIDIEEIISIARAAGDAIMEIYNSGDLEVQTKTDGEGFESPLTKADIASHKLITGSLHDKFPNIPIVSEEQDVSLNLEAMKAEKTWVIDPIDGTKGFVKRDGEFTINIGLLVDGTPVLGVVYAPAHDLLFYGDENGAFVDDGTGAEQIESAKSTTVKRAVASKNHLDEVTSMFLDQFGDIEMVQAGSSLKICKVASGEADIYPRLAPTTMEWDTAAADAVLRAAGGKMTGIDGGNLAYGKPDLRNNGFVAHGPNIEFSL